MPDVEITQETIEKTVASGKRYCLALWKAGPDREQPAEEANRIQMEHLGYLIRLVAEGVLLINGPVLNDPVYTGISIANLTDPEETRRLFAADPAVRAGRDVVEVYAWFGIPGQGLR